MIAKKEMIMFEKKGKYSFGFWDSVYGPPTDKYEDFKLYRNTINKATVIKHIESLDDWLICDACGYSTDLFTGEKFNAGIYCDGDFVFSVDFFRYYKTQDIGIPYEYEKYLRQKLRIINDPEDFNGVYVGAGDFKEVIINEYDILRFAAFKRKTGKSWNELSKEEQDSFKLKTTID